MENIKKFDFITTLDSSFFSYDYIRKEIEVETETSRICAIRNTFVNLDKLDNKQKRVIKRDLSSLITTESFAFADVINNKPLIIGKSSLLLLDSEYDKQVIIPKKIVSESSKKVSEYYDRLREIYPIDPIFPKNFYENRQTFQELLTDYSELMKSHEYFAPQLLALHRYLYFITQPYQPVDLENSLKLARTKNN